MHLHRRSLSKIPLLLQHSNPKNGLVIIYIANLLHKFQSLGCDLRPDFTDTKSAFNSEIPIIIRIKHYFITSKIKLRSFEQRMNFHQSNKIYNGTKFLSG